MYVDFDSEPHELHFPKQTEDVKRVQAELKHGLRIKVSGFRMSPFEGSDSYALPILNYRRKL